MSLFDTVKDDDILEELKNVDLEQYDANRCFEQIIRIAE